MITLERSEAKTVRGVAAWWLAVLFYRQNDVAPVHRSGRGLLRRFDGRAHWFYNQGVSLRAFDMKRSEKRSAVESTESDAASLSLLLVVLTSGGSEWRAGAGKRWQTAHFIYCRFTAQARNSEATRGETDQTLERVSPVFRSVAERNGGPGGRPP